MRAVDAGDLVLERPRQVAAVKEATRRVRDLLALDDADDIILSCYLSQDFEEGARAFLEKRTPNWRGV
jgi:enoyl-CoA hydratase